MIIHNPILTGSFTVNGTDVSSITSSAASLTSLNSYTASQNILNGTYATTGSNTFAGIQTVNSNLVVTGSITAQTLVVQTVTSSVVYSSGSNVFGNNIANTQVFTGSMLVTGSSIFSGYSTFSSSINEVGRFKSSNANGMYITFESSSAIIGDVGNSSEVFTGASTLDFGINARNNRKLQLGVNQTVVMTINGSNVGIGTSSPLARLTVVKATRSNTLGASSVLQISDASATGQAVGDRAEINFYTNSDSLPANLQHATIGIIKTSTTGNETADLYFATSTIGGSPVERMRITSDGNVGIGITNPSSILQVASAQSLAVIRSTTTTNYAEVQIENTTNYLQVGVEGATGNRMGGTIAYNAYLGSYANYGMTFHTNNLNRMTITSAGDVLIGATSTASAYSKVTIRGTNQGLAIQDAATNNYRAIYSQSGALYFYNGTNEGYLSSGGTWVNASDITLKKDVKEIEYGIDEVMKLKPKWYRMIEDNLEQIGFIAQDVEEILPELVSTSERGMKGLSYGQLTAVLVKAIQELQAQITELKNK